MSDDSFFYSSGFAQWSAQHEPIDYQRMLTLREEAIVMLAKSVSDGEITTIDGVDSPLSTAIKVHHRLTDFEMNAHWIGSSQAWICPCCGRSKFHISRVGKKNQILAKLVVHHDHMGEALKAAFHAAFAEAGTLDAQIEGKRLVERIGSAFAAYEEVLICEDCNNADTEAKKQVEAPSFFSFSIGQIRSFIQSSAHRPHDVDAGAAHHRWKEARPAYELRMELIRTVARAAATDTHWYESYDRKMQPVPTLGNGHRTGDTTILRWISIESLCKALGPQQKAAPRNLTRWRTTEPKQGRPLPANFLAMLQSDEDRARRWEQVADDWSCPICRRTKMEVLYVGDNGKVSFHTSTNHGRGAWQHASHICNHCSSTLMSLKTEISELTGNRPKDSYAFASPDELARIIISRPHTAHQIRPTEAAALVLTIVDRLTDSP
ncbi:hypothetical protein [Burkholderia gladioli]|uniref:hypothetical protein n=1 Tax=Burkholderia gladioli TaxID=28095 RepID=UPI00164084FE|nr:hypothetical protein [Burkholderia gladioli]